MFVLRKIPTLNFFASVYLRENLLVALSVFFKNPINNIATTVGDESVSL